jgi:hypothetical protein
MKKEYLISLVIVVVGFGAALCILFLPIPFAKNNQAGIPVAVAPTHPAPTGVPGTAGKRPVAATEAAAHNNTALLPHASETYQVMQASSTMPKIVQATIDPLGVHVGDTQHLSIVLQDPNQIVSAEALIQTDHSTTTLQLALVGPTQVSELLPQKYYVDSQNNLAFVNNAAPVAATGGSAGGQAGTGVARAATGGDVTYAGAWLVHDTHDTTYRTTFVVKDSAGNTNSVVLAWSDACSIPTNPSVGSTVTPSFTPNCAISAIDGVENANTNISGSMTLSAPFVFNPGYNITFSGGGSININYGTGVLEQGFLYAPDNDGDGYSPPASTVFSTASLLGGYVHRYNLAGTGDCNDSNANVFPGQPGWFTTPAVTNINLGTGLYDGGGEVNFSYSCSGGVSYQYSNVSYPSHQGNCVISDCSSECISTVNGTTNVGTPACGSTFQSDQQVCAGGTPNPTPVPGYVNTYEQLLICAQGPGQNFNIYCDTDVPQATQGCH